MRHMYETTPSEPDGVRTAHALAPGRPMGWEHIAERAHYARRMDGPKPETERDNARRRLDAIYSELREMVQPAATFNDAPFARREELEREASDLRQRWDLRDPRDTVSHPPGPITTFFRRQWAFYAGPMFTLAVMLTVVWVPLGGSLAIAAIREPVVWRIGLAVAGVTLACGWVILLSGAIAHRRRQKNAAGPDPAARTDHP